MLQSNLVFFWIVYVMFLKLIVGTALFFLFVYFPAGACILEKKSLVKIVINYKIKMKEPCESIYILKSMHFIPVKVETSRYIVYTLKCMHIF